MIFTNICNFKERQLKIKNLCVMKKIVSFMKRMVNAYFKAYAKACVVRTDGNYMIYCFPTTGSIYVSSINKK